MDIDKLTIGEARQAIAKGRELESLMGGAQKTIGETKSLELKRVVLVVDRGWIFAGDQSLTSDGYVKLSNAVHVFGWSGVGFTRMVSEWKSDKVDLRPCADVEVPQDAIVFRVPVDAGWGRK